MIPKTSSALWLAGMSVVVVAIATISIIVAITTGNGTALDANTPEGTVQRYIRALQNESYDEAFNLLSPATQKDCTLVDFRDRGRFAVDQDARIRLIRVQEASDGTEVSLELKNYSGVSPIEFDFTFDNGRFTVTYVTVEADDGWLISYAPWPNRGCSAKPPFPIPMATPTPTQATTSAAPTLAKG